MIFILPVQAGDDVIAQPVHHMNRPAVHVKDNIISVTFILMYQNATPFSLSGKNRPLPDRKQIPPIRQETATR